ncbi:TPA: M48 family metalloprotease, partial [Candidatus Woesearchaeota archaeon]|nr:M48 family metalloprotease [Candidatus Woesearchaeota archaeon]
MRINLGFASLITLGLLSGFVFAIIAAIMYFAGNISWAWMLAITIIFNLVMWLVGPTLSDFMYRWFYRATFYKEEDLKGKKFATFIRKVCDKHKIPYPTIGIIPDNNPTAFTYGSGPWNSRIVLSEGLFHYLNEDELEAVIAHELGHIVHKDFIVMAVASLLLQILYQLYVIFARGSMSRGSALGKRGSKDDDGSSLIIIGYVSLLFYYIGMYVLLFLSRLREYYADEFSAQETGDPNLLSSALI